MAANTTASNNTTVGAFTLDSNTDNGTVITALGHLALQANTTNGGITAIGFATLDANTTGANNTGVGRGALELNTLLGDSNVADR